MYAWRIQVSYVFLAHGLELFYNVLDHNLLLCELKISNKHINFILTKNLKSRVQLNHSQKYQNLCGNSSNLERKSMEQLLPNPL